LGECGGVERVFSDASGSIGEIENLDKNLLLFL